MCLTQSCVSLNLVMGSVNVSVSLSTTPQQANVMSHSVTHGHSPHKQPSFCVIAALHRLVVVLGPWTLCGANWHFLFESSRVSECTLEAQQINCIVTGAS